MVQRPPRHCCDCGVEIGKYKTALRCKSCNMRERARNLPPLPLPADCAECGQPTKARGRQFCSTKCMSIDRERRWAEQGHPRRVERVERACEWCGEVFKTKRESKRFCSEACATRHQWELLDEAGKLAQVAQAHVAATGRVHPEVERRRMAATRETRQVSVGSHERTFADLLSEGGISFVQQYATGRYNLDFFLPELAIAVEICTNAPSAQWGTERGRRRLEHILDRWHLYEIRINHDTKGLWSPRVVADLVAFAKRVSGQPASPGQHRVVRPNGKPVASYAERQGRADVPGARHGNEPAMRPNSAVA